MRNVKIFFKSAGITFLCLLYFTAMYLGFCKTYEAMQSTLFEDTRSAVQIGENYIKFFDMEFYF